MAKKAAASRKTAQKKSAKKKGSTARSAARRGTTKRSTAKRSSAKRSSAKRSVVDTGKARMFAKRRADGTFKEMDESGRSLSTDRRQSAKKKTKSGYGDQGDRKRASKKR